MSDLSFTHFAVDATPHAASSSVTGIRPIKSTETETASNFTTKPPLAKRGKKMTTSGTKTNDVVDFCTTDDARTQEFSSLPSVDEKSTQLLAHEYCRITAECRRLHGSRTVVLMQVGSFMQMYGLLNPDTGATEGSLLSECADVCGLGIGACNHFVGRHQALLAGFRDVQLDRYLRLLQDAGYVVVVYMQDPQTPGVRTQVGVFSPGTYFPDTAAPNQLSNHTTCIWIYYSPPHSLLGRRQPCLTIGMASLDIFTGESQLFQTCEEGYQRGNPCTYDEVERFLSIHQPSEIAVVTNLPKEADVDEMLAFAHCRCTMVHRVHIGGARDKETIPTIVTPSAATTVPSNTSSPPSPSSPHEDLARCCQKQSYQREILARFFPGGFVDRRWEEFHDQDVATQAFCFLLDFVCQRNPALLRNITPPQFDYASSRLILANHSLKQLSVLEDGSDSSHKESCVAQFLNECITAMGKRHFRHQLLHPMRDPTWMQREYDAIEFLLPDARWGHYHPVLREQLSKIRDVSKWLRMIALRKMTPRAFAQLYTTLTHVLYVAQTMFANKEDMTFWNTYLRGGRDGATSSTVLEDVVAHVTHMQRHLETHLVIDRAMHIDQVREVDVDVDIFLQRGVFPQLDACMTCFFEDHRRLEAIRQYLHGCIARMESKAVVAKGTELVKMVEVSSTKQRMLQTTERRFKFLRASMPSEPSLVQLTYCLPWEEGERATGELDGEEAEEGEHGNRRVNSRTFLLDIGLNAFQSGSIPNSKTVNIHHAEMNGMMERLPANKDALAKQQMASFAAFVESCDKWTTDLRAVAEFITAVDVLHTKASLARKYKYCKPTLASAQPIESDAKTATETGTTTTPSAQPSFIQCTDLRHCLIEQLPTCDFYVANDVMLGCPQSDAEPSSPPPQGMLLYGTNAVGKTSLIRALGVAVIMAQAGMFVPCSTFVFRPYHVLFTRILGNDKMTKGMSTFQVEMSELRTILRMADANSLVLGDELCSGTETHSAVSIVVSGIQSLVDARATFVFATHFHEIVDFDEIRALRQTGALSLQHMTVTYNPREDRLVYNRRLQAGPGDSVYGLEVCKSMHMPAAFLDRAYGIRNKYFPSLGAVAGLKRSRYNADKILGVCERCRAQVAVETHHIHPQASADAEGWITTDDGRRFHKNALANLMGLCESCHEQCHRSLPGGW